MNTEGCINLLAAYATLARSDYISARCYLARRKAKSYTETSRRYAEIDFEIRSLALSNKRRVRTEVEEEELKQLKMDRSKLAPQLRCWRTIEECKIAFPELAI